MPFRFAVEPGWLNCAWMVSRESRFLLKLKSTELYGQVRKIVKRDTKLKLKKLLNTEAPVHSIIFDDRFCVIQTHNESIKLW